MGIFRRVDMFIWLFKAGWFYFWSVTNNFSQRRSCIGCISVFFKSLCNDPFLLLFGRSCYLADFFFIKNCLLKGQVYSFLSCFINNDITPFCWLRIQDSLLSGVELMRSLVFDRIWFDNVDWCLFGCVDADLLHSGGKIYSQNSSWHWFKSWNELLTYLHLIFL